MNVILEDMVETRARFISIRGLGFYILTHLRQESLPAHDRCPKERLLMKQVSTLAENRSGLGHVPKIVERPDA